MNCPPKIPTIDVFTKKEIIEREHQKLIRDNKPLVKLWRKIMCFCFGHKWKDYEYIDSHGGLDGYTRCMRCGQYD